MRHPEPVSLLVAIALCVVGGSRAVGQAILPSPAIAVTAGVLRPGPLFDRGPDAVRLAVQLEPSTTSAWRPQFGVEVWDFVIGCDSSVGAECGPFGLSVHAALVRQLLPASAGVGLYLGAGVAGLRGPNRRLGFMPDARVGVEFLTRRPVAVRLEARVQSLIRRQRLNLAGDHRWHGDEATAFIVGARIRLRRR